MPTPRALILGVEISNPSALGTGGGSGPSVALVERSAASESDESSIAVVACEPVGTGSSRGGHDDDLIPAIDRLFRVAGRSVRELKLVAVSGGPGGYTSLRVACAAGAMIAEASGALCVRVPTAMGAVAVIDQAAIHEQPEGPIIIALASKADSGWVELRERFGPPIGGALDVRASRAVVPGQVMDAGGLAKLIDRGARVLIADQHLPASFAERARLSGVRIIAPRFDARAIALLAACSPNLPGLDPRDPAALVPIYPREPEAVTLWRTRRPDGRADGREGGRAP
jgi:tRNA A37 threonylcarbamoyladenosine modification protein TsaB